MLNSRNALCICIVVFLLPCISKAADLISTGSELIETVARPNYDATLSFPATGRILEILVAPGDKVSKGNVLVRFDNRPEKARLKILKLDMDSTIRIQASEAQLELKEVELSRAKKLYDMNIETKKKYDEAVLGEELARLSLDLTRLDMKKYVIECEQLEAQIDLKCITAQVDGVVAEVMVEVGESVEQAEPVLRLVNIDELWADVPVPITSSDTLNVNDKVEVYLSSNASELPIDGRILHVSAVADAAIGARIVRISFPSQSKRVAGVRVWVGFNKGNE